MSQLCGIILGGLIGYAIGWVLIFWIPNRRHRRETARKFNRFVASLPRYEDYESKTHPLPEAAAGSATPEEDT
jgi:membrane protein YqaA with SNARE-associated domain